MSKDINKTGSLESDEYFDANDYFVEQFSDNGLDNVRQLLNGLDGNTSAKSVTISRKDESNKQVSVDLSPPSDGKPNDKDVNEDNDTEDNELDNNLLEVVIDTEDDIEINLDDIEMTATDSIRFLVYMIAILVVNLFIICGTTHWIYNYLGGIDWSLTERFHFTIHIFFMTLGICGFGLGMLTHRMFRGLSSGALNCLHTTFTLLSLIFFVIGVYAVFVSLNAIQCVHFYSVHSWVGLIAILAFIMQWLSGLIVYIFPRFIYEIQILLTPIHNFLGRLVFTLFCGTAIIGISDKLRITVTDLEGLGPIDPTNYTSVELPFIKRETDRYWQMPREALIGNVIAIALLLNAIFVNFLSANDSYRRRLLPEEQGIEVKTQVKK